MAADESDLWPSDLVVDVLSPAMILNEQAEALTKRTQGLIRGEVNSGLSSEFDQITFDLYAPALGFRHRFLYVRYHKDYPYPAVIIADPLFRLTQAAHTDAVTSKQWKLSDLEQQRARIAPTPRDFQSLLKLVFSATGTRSILFSLIARSNEVTGTPRGNGHISQPPERTGNEAEALSPTDSQPPEHTEPTS